MTRQHVDVLVPTCDRPAALAVTLTALLAQADAALLRVVVGDQGVAPAAGDPVVAGVLRVLRHHAIPVDVLHRPERRGVAENRQALLEAATAELLLVLDDDVLLGPGALARLLRAEAELGPAMVGAASTGLSYLADERPHEWVTFERVTGPVVPERVRKQAPGWERWRLHNAANPTHLAAHHPPEPGAGYTAYRIAWSAGCFLARRQAVLDAGGWAFWTELPAGHAGEDVVLQLRLQERGGAVGVLPTGAYHLELPTTVTDRRADAYALVLEAGSAGAD